MWTPEPRAARASGGGADRAAVGSLLSERSAGAGESDERKSGAVAVGGAEAGAADVGVDRGARDVHFDMRVSGGVSATLQKVTVQQGVSPSSHALNSVNLGNL